MRSATDSLEEQAAARVAAAVCGKRVVLLGELPEHGHARGFGVKARIVERLVARCGFRAVLFEAGSFDFFGLERAIAATQRAPGGAAAGAGRTDSLELALARAIGGFWSTRELAGWRRWLLREAVAGRVAIGGLDDQPSATAAHARATLPGRVAAAAPPARAAECRDAVERYLNWRYTEAVPYDSTERARLADCTRLAADRVLAARTSTARAAERRTPDQIMLADIATHFAREHNEAAAPDRDLVMAQHLAWWSARLPRDARIVVWTATVHAAREPGASPVLPLGVPPLGARLAERWGDRLAVIGFTALRGQWSRAGGPIQPLAPLPPHALEARALAAGAAGDTAGWAYLDRAALRSLGAVPSRLFGGVSTTDWSAAFDGVLVIRDEAPPTREPRR
ncbi:MAG TPA: erythromycin esterase family protein [Longimicrobium sp.]|nr:erythromycin esterase family protein [Longimicrobium sp.]